MKPFSFLIVAVPLLLIASWRALPQTAMPPRVMPGHLVTAPAMPSSAPSLLRQQATGIEWDVKTLTFVKDGFYGRLMRLANGDILCSYEGGGQAWVARSRDDGKTWSEGVLAAEIAGANPANPEMLQLQNGRVLLFYNQRPHDGTLPFAIGYCFSDDNGQTWQRPAHLIYEASPDPKNGCWEPAAIQLASGEIQLFFANEFPYQQSDEQEISLMRSFDNGQTWSKATAVSFRAGHRDGMPVPVQLHDGGRPGDIVFAIEDNGLGTRNMLQPAIIHTSLEKNWQQPVVTANSAHRWNGLDVSLPDDVYAGAPYLRQLPSGETVLSCHSTEGGRKRPQMVVYIGNREARFFAHPSAPFNLPPDVAGEYNCLFIKNATTVTALSATTINGRRGLWAIDGHVTWPATGR